MKLFLVTLITFFYVVYCNDSVVYLTDQQFWNSIVSNRDSKFGSFDKTTRTILVSNPITFSTQHRFHGHYYSTPQYDLNRMSTEQLARYFYTRGYTEAEILSHPMLYMSQAYLALVKQLPRYPEFVKKYYEKYRQYKGLYKFWEKIHFRYRSGMKKQFARLYHECEQQRKIKKAQRNAVQQRDTNNTKLRGIDAAIICFAHEYDITEQQLLTTYNDHYEQQLHHEFLEQLTEAHTASVYYALQPKNILIDAVGHGIAIGMEANSLHERDTATAWASFGRQVLEIIAGIGEGLVLFAENNVHMICHPIHTLKQIVHCLGQVTGICACTIGTVAHWHELMECGDGLLMAQEMDQVANKVTEFGGFCVEQIAALEARDVAKYGTAIAADILFTHKMLVFGSQLYTKSKPIIVDIMQVTSAERASVELALQGAEEPGIAKRIHLLQEAEEGGLQNIISHAKQITLEEAMTKWEASEGLKKLERQCNCISNKISDTRLGLCENKPDLLVRDYANLEKLALQKYEYIRSVLDDTNVVAKNTGIAADTIKQIKEHVFFKEHILWDGVKRFPPDIDMANAWERLVSNTFLKSDLEFLKHEFAESILMGSCEVPWRSAHDLTDTIYNWTKYLEGKI